MVRNYIRLFWDGELNVLSSYHDYLNGNPRVVETREIRHGQVIEAEALQVIGGFLNLHFKGGTVAIGIPQGMWEKVGTDYGLRNARFDPAPPC